MKIFTLLAVSGIILCATPTIKAQESQSPWTFGVKAGVNASTFKVDDGSILSNTEGIAGFNGGVTVEYALRNNFFLSSGLEFTTKGADYSTSYYGISQLEEDNSIIYAYSLDSRRLKYLQVPLTIGYRIPVSKDVNVTFNAGAYFALGISGKGKHQLAVMNVKTNGTSEVTYSQSRINKKGDTDYGLLGGIGLEYKRLSLNANYEYGLRSLYTGESYHTGNSYNTLRNDAWRNRNLVFSVGYKF